MFGQPEDDSLYPIFVYGTLRRGCKNHHLLRHRTLTEQVATVEGMNLYSLGSFPVMVHGGGRVYGELVTLQPFLYRDILADLDRLEGYDPQYPKLSVYQRELIAVMVTDHDAFIPAWAYIAYHMPQAELEDRLIESGDWTQHRQKILQNTRFGRFYEN